MILYDLYGLVSPRVVFLFVVLWLYKDQESNGFISKLCLSPMWNSCLVTLHLTTVTNGFLFDRAFISRNLEQRATLLILFEALSIKIHLRLQPHSMMSWNLTSKKSSTEMEYGVWKLLPCSFTYQSQKNLQSLLISAGNR